MKSYKLKEFHTWTEAEIKKYENYWPIESKQRLAFALHLYTRQRRSDIHRMTWRDIENTMINVTQQKTGTKLSIPIHPELHHILNNEKKHNISILVTSHGKPFSVAGYGQWINESIKQAGLPENCKAHGLRKASARRLAENG